MNIVILFSAINITTYLRRLFLTQKRLYVLSRTYHSQPIFKKLHILPLANLNDLQVACCIYRPTHRLLPTYFCDMFITNNYVHVHDTRLSNSLHIFGHTKNILRYTIRIFGPLLWNWLSADLRNISTVYLFKTYHKHQLPHDFKYLTFNLYFLVTAISIIYAYKCMYLCVHIHVYVCV